MKVREIMVSNPACCRRDTDLATATALLRKHNCGALPIIDQDRRAVGIITDRDICIAVGTSNKRAVELFVGEVAAGKVVSCSEDSNIHDALACMQHNHVRRLVVTDDLGRVQGILSIDDILLNIQWSETKKVAPSFANVIRVLKAITYPAQPRITSILTFSNSRN
jgi:CBS domain-containing protein